MKQAKRIVVVIDMQNDFISGALGTPEAKAIVPAVVARMQAEQEAGALLVLRGIHMAPIILQRLRASCYPRRIAKREPKAGSLRAKSRRLHKMRSSLTSPRSAASLCPPFCARMLGRIRSF